MGKDMSDTDKFELPEDVFERAKYHEFLTSYLSSVNTPFVINIDAGWGYGKTYFIKQWINSISNMHPAIYINAWESDFSNDPLLVLISEVTKGLEEAFPDSKALPDKVTSIITKSGVFCKAGAPALVKGAAKYIMSEDGVNGIEEAIADSAGKLVEISLKEHSRFKSSIDKFKVELSSLKEVYDENDGLSGPLFIFVDELDRCRPTYSVEFLEQIKHIFSAEGIVFIIATDTTQLCHSIGAVYGEKFDSHLYLTRFFDREYVLPAPNYKRFASALLSGKSYEGLLTFPENDDGEVFAEYFAFFANFFRLNLRTQEQCAARLDALLLVQEGGTIHVPYITFLIMLRAVSKEDFNTWFHKREFVDKGYKSSETIMLYDNIGPINVINAYLGCVFESRDKLMRKVNNMQAQSPNNSIAIEVHKNLNSIKTYKDKVELVGAVL